MDSPDRAPSDQPTLEGAPNEAGATLEEGVPVVRPLDIDEIENEAPSGVANAPLLPPRPTSVGSRRKRLLDRILLNTYVPPLKRIHPSTGMVDPDPEGVLEIAHRWNPLNQAESPVVHMPDLYPNYFRIPVATRSEQYTILLPVYMDKEAFQPMAEDGMLICNHEFHRSTELVYADF